MEEIWQKSVILILLIFGRALVMRLCTNLCVLVIGKKRLPQELMIMDFPESSVGKGPSCKAGEPGSIPGLGRSAGEGIGHPLQYSWASLVSQLVKYLPAMQEMWVQALVWEDPLEKGKATHSSILAWRIPWTV